MYKNKKGVWKKCNLEYNFKKSDFENFLKLFFKNNIQKTQRGYEKKKILKISEKEKGKKKSDFENL